MGLENKLVPARFYAVLGHFICVCLVFTNKEEITSVDTEQNSYVINIYNDITIH